MYKKQLFTLLLLILLRTIAIGQNTAESLNSSLYDIGIWDENHVTAVGGKSILSSGDQGDSWTLTSVNILEGFNTVKSIQIVNDQIGVAIGAKGSIWRTTDKGLSWTQIPSITGNEDFLRLQFIDGVGYLAGRNRVGTSTTFTTFLYKSTDLGASWQEVPSNIVDFGGFNPWIRMHFVSPTEGFLQAGNGGGNRYTIDGGITWDPITTLPNQANVNSMQFVDENIGYMYAENASGIYTVHSTNDAGNTWSSLDFTQGSERFKVQGSKIYYGSFAGWDDSIRMANVDGSNQESRAIYQQGYINNIEFLNDNIGFIVGRRRQASSSMGRFIFKTLDAGNTWLPVDDASHLEGTGNGSMRYLNKVAPNTYVRSDVIAEAGNTKFHIVHSYDNGTSWQVTNTYDSGGEVTYADGNFICHVRYFDPINSGNGIIISESNDGGQTFTESPVITDHPFAPFILWQQVSEDVIFVESGAFVLRSIDQGVTWEELPIPSGISSYRSQFISDSVGYLYGENEVTETPEIYKTEDGGENWTFLFNIPTHFFDYFDDAFDFSDENRLIVIPRFPVTGSAFLYDLNTSILTEVNAPEHVKTVKSVNSSSYVAMVGEFNTHYTNDNGANYTNLMFRVDEASTSVPPFFVEPDGSFTLYDYAFIKRIKPTTPFAPAFLEGPEVVDVGTEAEYFLSQDEFADTEWDLLSGGGLVLDPDFQNYKASVLWTDPGTHTLRARRTSDLGNSEYVEIQVTVNGDPDTDPPTVLTQDITVFLDGNGAVVIEPLDIDNGSSDNLTPFDLLVFELDTYSFFCNDIGDNEVTLTVTDLSGNSASATAIVTVIDDMTPTMITQNITVGLNGNPSVSIVPEDVDNGSSDNCSILSLELDIDTFTTIGDQVVTLTATDGSNNTNSETAIVTVVDILGVSENTNFELTVFPNPIQESLSVVSSLPYERVQVFDLSGRLVTNFNYQDTYDLSKLNPGIYIMVFNSKTDGSIQKSIIKE
ncbi:MAG: hypothetical protein Aureis2KO_25900 [Aureisphaera sp.]